VDREKRQALLEAAFLDELPRLQRSLGLLATLAGIAPLLGLLGTVSGMIATFATISQLGTGNPRLLSGGISQALITTQLGLIVAIPLLLAHAWLRRWGKRREAQLEYDTTRACSLTDEDAPQASGPSSRQSPPDKALTGDNGNNPPLRKGHEQRKGHNGRKRHEDRREQQPVSSSATGA
jgi:hypothetical protein